MPVIAVLLRVVAVVVGVCLGPAGAGHCGPPSCGGGGGRCLSRSSWCRSLRSSFVWWGGRCLSRSSWCRSLRSSFVWWRWWSVGVCLGPAGAGHCGPPSCGGGGGVGPAGAGHCGPPSCGGGGGGCLSRSSWCRSLRSSFVWWGWSVVVGVSLGPAGAGHCGPPSCGGGGGRCLSRSSWCRSLRSSFVWRGGRWVSV